jgi:hypothetical protein
MESGRRFSSDPAWGVALIPRLYGYAAHTTYHLPARRAFGCDPARHHHWRIPIPSKLHADRPCIFGRSGGIAYMRFQSVFPSPHAFRLNHPNPVPVTAAGAPLFTRAVAVFRVPFGKWLA